MAVSLSGFWSFCNYYYHLRSKVDFLSILHSRGSAVAKWKKKHSENLWNHSANLYNHSANLNNHSANLYNHSANLNNHSANLCTHSANL